MASPNPSPGIRRTRTEHADVHTPQSYAGAIHDYSKITHEHSLYPGQSFETLAEFLRGAQHHQSPSTLSNGQAQARIQHKSASRSIAYELTNTSTTTTNTSRHPSFATHYALTSTSRAQATHLSTPGELERLATLHTPGERSGQLLILQGYPSAAWLCSIGATYDVDPEFFRCHLSFLNPAGSAASQRGVADLPSSQGNIVQFRLPGVGSYTGPKPVRDGGDLMELRRQAQANMETYLHELLVGMRWRTGDSVVRNFWLHDEECFSVEQVVTLYFSRLRTSADHWVMILFLDSGKDAHGFEWLGLQSPAHHHPIPHQKRQMALKPHVWKDHEEDEESPAIKNHSRHLPLESPWTASRLHLRYGRMLRPEMMSQDPFYTLNELFSLTACAEAQLLDVIEHGMVEDSWQAIQEAFDPNDIRSKQSTRSQNNLVHNRRVLEARLANLRHILSFIERQRNSDSWPHCTDTRQLRETDAAARTLQMDFQHLHDRAENLYQRCESAMTLAMNRASIAEARRNFQQGQVLSRFTGLAFAFVPASSIASIFGMNFLELGTGKHSIWIFFAVVVPVFCIVFMFLFDGWRRSWQGAKHTYQKLSVKLASD